MGKRKYKREVKNNNMETTNTKSDTTAEQITIRENDSEDKPKTYNFDEAIDLAGELYTYHFYLNLKNIPNCNDFRVLNISDINLQMTEKKTQKIRITQLSIH